MSCGRGAQWPSLIGADPAKMERQRINAQHINGDKLDVIRQRMGEDGAKMYEWFDRVGYTVDRAALRREFPDVAFQDFEAWAKA